MKLKTSVIFAFLTCLKEMPFCSAAALAAAIDAQAATASSSSSTTTTNPLVHARPSADPGLVWAKRNLESITTMDEEEFSATSKPPQIHPRDDFQTFQVHYCSGAYKSQGVCGGPCSTTNGTNGAPVCVSAPSTQCVVTQGGLVFSVCLEAGCLRCTASEDLKGSEVGGYWFYDLGALAGVVSLSVAV